LFNHGIERRWLDENPTAGIKFYPIKKKAKYIPPFEDIERILQEATFEQYLYLNVVIYSLGRIREINKLEWDDLRGDHLILRTRKSKNSDIVERKIPISGQLEFVLDEIPHVGEYVFINPRTQRRYDYRKGMMNGLCKRARVRKFGFHSLRHYGASKLASEGIPLTDIQALLGHQQVTTTAIYLQSLKKSLKEAVELISPQHSPQLKS
jgi:integrase